MARPKKTEAEKAAAKADKAKASDNNDKMLEAVSFVAPGFKENTDAYATHVAIINNTISTFDGVLQFTAPIDVGFTAFPHFDKLRTALDRMGDGGSIVVDKGAVVVKSGRMKATVPMLPNAADCMRLSNDPPQYALPESVLETLKMLLPIVKESGDSVLESTFLITGSTVLASDRFVMVERMHGATFYPEMVIPRKFVAEWAKIKLKTLGYGYSANSLTIYFENNYILRTQLWPREDWPNIDNIWPINYPPLTSVPEGMFEAISSCRPFMDEAEMIFFSDDLVHTHEENGVGIEIVCKGMIDAPTSFTYNRLMKLAGLLPNMGFDERNRLVFADATMRGVLAGIFRPSDEADTETQDERPAEAAPQAAPIPSGPITAAETRPAVEPASTAAYTPPAGFGASAMPPIGETGGQPEADVVQVLNEGGFVSMEIDMNANNATDIAFKGVGDPAFEPMYKGLDKAPVALADVWGPGDYNWRQYADPSTPAYINGKQWAEANQPCSANPITDDMCRADPNNVTLKCQWYEGWRSVTAPRSNA